MVGRFARRWWGAVVPFILAAVLNLSGKQNNDVVPVLLFLSAIWTWIAICTSDSISRLRTTIRIALWVFVFMASAIVFILSVRFFAPLTKNVPSGPVLVAWGGQPNQHICGVVVDGSKLMPWSEKCEVAFICGFGDSTTDKFSDTRVTISQYFTIHQGHISISSFYSPRMLALENQIKADAAKRRISKVHINLWYEIVLVPKDKLKNSMITVEDFRRAGGFLLSEGFPK